MYVLHRLFPLYLSFHLIFSETWIFNPASSTRYVHPMCNENKKNTCHQCFGISTATFKLLRKKETRTGHWIKSTEKLWLEVRKFSFSPIWVIHIICTCEGEKGGSPNAYIYCLDCIIAIVLYVQGWEGKWGSNFAILLYTFNNRLSLGSEDPSSPKWLKM